MDEKDEIIIEFITKLQGLAFKEHGWCFVCSGPGYTEPGEPKKFKPKHTSGCLFSRAESIIASNEVTLLENDIRMLKIRLVIHEQIPLLHRLLDKMLEIKELAK